MYRTFIKPAGVNPLTGKKQYRVIYSTDNFISLYMSFNKLIISLNHARTGEKLMNIKTNKRYQVGTFINPRRALGI